MGVIHLHHFNGLGLGRQLLENALASVPEMDVTHIELRVHTHNRTAIHLYEKKDFIRAGILPNAARTPSGLQDEIIYF